MKDHVTLLSITPAPAGLVAVFMEGRKEFITPVAAFGLLLDQNTIPPEQYAAALVINQEFGTLEPAAESSNFDRLEWRVKE